MWRLRTRIGFPHFLPVLAAAGFLVTGAIRADEKFTNELASPIDEPQVIIPENSSQVPVRPIALEIQNSTDPLVKFVYDTREAQRRRLLSTKTHTPWQMMHGLLGLRQDFLIEHNGKTVSGLEWIQTGPIYQNEAWFQKTSFGGQAHPFNKPYWFEGHINQFLAILAMCDVPLDAQFGTPQGPITMRDMLKNAQMTANAKEEVTWTLWALSTYLPSDAQWVNAKGEKWSIERLVQLEVAKTVGGPTSPCGGTHGLYALARARNVYLRTGKPLRGVWAQADQKIQKYIQTAYVNRNPDGSLSSSFFKGREYKKDFDKRMASEGHVLEFLMMALPPERLKEQWVRRAIETTAKDLMDNRKQFVSCSPLYHATNAMTIYLNRVAPAAPQQVAQKPPGTQSVSSSKELKTVDASGKPSTAVPAMPTPAGNTAPGTSLQVVPKTGSPATTTKTPDAAKQATEPSKEKPKVEEPASGEKAPVMVPQAQPPAAPASGPLIPVPLPDPSDPAPVEPTPTNPTPTSPTPVEPGAVQPEPAKPGTTEPGTIEPGTTEPPMAEPVKTEPAPAMPLSPTPTSPAVSPQPLPSSEAAASPSLELTIPMSMPTSDGEKKTTTSRSTVSAERPEIIAGTAEAVAPMIEPVPLNMPTSNLTTQLESSSQAPINATAPTPLMAIPTTPATAAVGPVSLSDGRRAEATASAITVVKLPVGGSGTKPPTQELPPLHNEKETPPVKPPAEWKATPLDRRRPIVVDDRLII